MPRLLSVIFAVFLFLVFNETAFGQGKVLQKLIEQGVVRYVNTIAGISIYLHEGPRTNTDSAPATFSIEEENKLITITLGCVCSQQSHYYFGKDVHNKDTGILLSRDRYVNSPRELMNVVPQPNASAPLCRAVCDAACRR